MALDLAEDSVDQITAVAAIDAHVDARDVVMIIAAIMEMAVI